ncbi:putative N-acetylmannosamine-6-phosphate 2-epimerase [Mesorhizobium sp. RP14(2022)]|uniref:N-acylglucosamine-6-phosphate 2-epimerase n=2 Tax=Mesorhizobium liriopis TaxID=2953882 RepID=A0ABT1CBH4_9HYPH|nr:putative N-acetylmannosamine-6-phosphate 2-epimerase [Mesorhizobium liriopis]
MDDAAYVVAFAKAAVAAGAVALRIESVAYLRAVRPAVAVPIVGIVKRDLDDSPVRITPFLGDVDALAEAGADIIAFDATDRTRPASVEALAQAVRGHGKLSMADCSTIEDARRAHALGIDYLGSTLSGYTGGPEPTEPDLALVAAMRELTPNVIAEGRIRVPEQARAAAAAGAHAVVVGSAITRTEHATAWFDEAVREGFACAPGASILALDIGGTKIAVAQVEGGTIRREAIVATRPADGPDAWIAAAQSAIADWSLSFSGIGIAATGVLSSEGWYALNPETLPIPNNYPLVERVTEIFGAPAIAVNDAQAAAWGEFIRGGHGGKNLVFLTISTGIGGGIVVNGQLLEGLSGSFGLLRGPANGGGPLEGEVSGRWIAAEAARAGHDCDAAGVFKRASAGVAWAEGIVAQSAARVATLCRDIQMMLDPDHIVIGGGIGLASGFLDRVRENLAALDPRLMPNIVPAKLGAKAGLVGVADVAARRLADRKTA